MAALLPLKRRCSAADPVAPAGRDLDGMEGLLEALLLGSGPDSSAGSVHLSLERILESRPCESDSSRLIERAMSLGSALLEAAKMSERKRSALHNSIAWPLPPELTVKVFSELDTHSIFYVAASCTMFKNCAMDPLCYANIDLTSPCPKVNNAVVYSMVTRAGKNLRSLKLGILPDSLRSTGTPQSVPSSTCTNSERSCDSWSEKGSMRAKDSYILTRSCLTCLSVNDGAAGALLRKLHLFNIDGMDSSGLYRALSCCPLLLDLEIVGLHIELRQMLESVSKYCHLMDRLFLESSKPGRDDSLRTMTCFDLVHSCSNLTSLALRGFKLQDHYARVLVKGLRKLKCVDFSTSYSVTGVFLRHLGSATIGPPLEVLTLRDCMHLKEVEVARFVSALFAGDCKFLRYLDISNKEGLASDEDWYNRCYNLRIPTSLIAEKRPGLCFLAEFPAETSFIILDYSTDRETISEESLPSYQGSPLSEDQVIVTWPDSSDHSSGNSGNEEGHGAVYAILEESSDEFF